MINSYKKYIDTEIGGVVSEKGTNCSCIINAVFTDRMQ